MSALSDGRKRRTPIEVIEQWWHAWTGNGTQFSEFTCCSENEVQRIAKDVGVSAAELRRLARLGPEAADLLLRRMAALDLNRKVVSQREPQMFRDLQRICSMCENHRLCARDIAHDSSNPAWEDYCPNVALLKMLNAMPWASRREG